MTAARATRPRPAAVLAIAWGLSFAAIHVAWALGSTAGLGGREVTGVLMAINVVAIPLCLLAALRGLGTVQALVAPPGDATTFTRLVDPFFLLGGVLFFMVARGARGRSVGAVELDDRFDVRPGAERVGDEAVLVRAVDQASDAVDVGPGGNDDARPQHDARDAHGPRV